ncbi:MAG: hypothetical protein HKN14_16110 [Marinicaulis sp.]|nr:hypothetical protein [Marinicaulis sp.]NNE42432.1 hypothetical protein [Marinicaulis sp.]NNL88715.1 hypothetical protein [Marinicaulis sp.]
MLEKVFRLGAVLGLMSTTAFAETTTSPYADWTDRQIKALSSEQISIYTDGKGGGYALAAELNGVPGPRHALELAESLGLSQSQHHSLMALFSEMETEAKALGHEIIQAEQRLDEFFANGGRDPEVLATLTGDVAALEGKLRAVHLAAHLKTAAILKREQTAQYIELRGYQENDGNHDGHDSREHGHH